MYSDRSPGVVPRLSAPTAVPTYDQFIEPLLRYLAAHADGAAVADVYDALADRAAHRPDDGPRRRRDPQIDPGAEGG